VGGGGRRGRRDGRDGGREGGQASENVRSPSISFPFANHSFLGPARSTLLQLDKLLTHLLELLQPAPLQVRVIDVPLGCLDAINVLEGLKGQGCVELRGAVVAVSVMLDTAPAIVSAMAHAAATVAITSGSVAVSRAAPAPPSTARARSEHTVLLVRGAFVHAATAIRTGLHPVFGRLSRLDGVRGEEYLV